MVLATLAPWPRRVQPAAPLVAFVFGVFAVVVVAADRGLRPSDGALSSYAGLSRLAAIGDAAAGLGLVVVAAAALRAPFTVRLGAAALAAAVAWFAPDFEGWTNGGAVVHSLGAAAVPLFPAALAWLVVVGARGRLRPRFLPACLTAGAVVVGVAALARAVVRDPLSDPYCWRNCIGNTFLVHASPTLARDLDRVWLGTGAALGIVLAYAAASSLGSATRAARRLGAPILVTGALSGIAQAAYTLMLLHDPAESPRRHAYALLFYGRASTVAALAVALLLTLGSTWRTRASLGRLARALAEAPAPGRLQEALADAFGDPSLEVRYWLPRNRRYVDADGRAAEALPGLTRAVTPILRNGSPVAAVLHDPALVGASFERELGAAARLAVENERLQAEVRAQVEALRRSRTRITERGDAERRRLERDLHDGAQQRLLALSYDLKLARTSADKALAAQLDAAAEQAQLALEELRQLAHGIYPAILAEAGLAPALASLADEAPLAVALDVPGLRYGESIEAAVYVAVREAIDDAAARGATWLGVVVSGRLELQIQDDGEPRSTSLVHVEDRIGALGGTVEVGERTLKAAIPCE